MVIDYTFVHCDMKQSDTDNLVLGGKEMGSG